MRLGSFINRWLVRVPGHLPGHRVRVAFCAFALACVPAVASDATHVRTRRSVVQSAGPTVAHGKVQPEQANAEPASRHGSRHARQVADDKQSDSKTKDSGKSARGAKKGQSAQAHAKRGRGHAQHQLKVEDPLPMSQAALPRSRRRSVREEVASHKNASLAPKANAANSKSPAHARATSAPTVAALPPYAAAAKPAGTAPPSTEPVKAATVDDFIRAANGGLLPGEVRDDDATPENDGRTQAVVSSKGAAPIEKEATVTSAKKSPVMASVSTAAPRVDAPTAGGPPARHVVSGFGAEVDVLPGAAVGRGGLSKKNAPPDELAMHDRALQQQLADDAMIPVVVPLYSRSGHLLIPAPLKGTHEILVHQNAIADQEGLARIQDDDDLAQMRAAHLLLPISDSSALVVNEELPMNRRSARPWTVKFVDDVSHAFYAKFHEPLRLSSAVRTVDFQRKLQRVNGNAAALDGDTASPHLTGQAIDFGKSGMSRAEVAWMRAYLLPLINAGKIDVEEEFQQSCFHISVYANYAPKKTSVRKDVALRQ